MTSSLYIGLISGTSMDAIDCALVDFGGDTPHQVDFINREIPESLKQKLLALCEDHDGQIPLLGEADVAFGRELAAAVRQVLADNNLEPNQVAAIGSHGQTVRHGPQGKPPFTLQIGDPNTLAELTGITTVADFRRRDMAAGGQGAPLVPAFHREILASAEQDRVILNIGGMSNITILERQGGIRGYDTGPGNVLMDAWIHAQQGQAFDRDGAWAASGSVNSELLDALLDEAYFRQPPPKSTGRELFNSHWLADKLSAIADAPTGADIQATLLALTTATVSAAIGEELDSGEVIVCGGGASNGHLMQALAEALPGFAVMPSSSLGVMADSVEAVAFAWMAHKTLHRQPIDFTAITGSKHPVIAGGIYWAG